MSVKDSIGVDRAIQRQLQAEQQARKAEKQANERIRTARKAVEQVKQESQQQLETIKNQHDQLELQEGLRHEERLSKAQSEGYQELARARMQQKAAERKLDQKGDRALQKVRNHYTSEIAKAKKGAENDVASIQRDHDRDIESAEIKGENRLKLVNEVYKDRIESDHIQNEQKLNNLHQAAKSQYERMSTDYQNAVEKNSEMYTDKYREIANKNNESLRNLHKAATQKLNDLRADSMMRLNAFDSRNDDPFYRLVDINGDFYETDDSFILQARVPLHEQNDISVNIRGNQLVVQGQKRNNETHELGPGKTVQTSSFQTFSETFPLSTPVHDNGVTRTFEGDLMTIRVPKKSNEWAQERPLHKSDRARTPKSDRPRWPDNIPISQTKAELELAKRDHLDYYDQNVQVEEELEKANQEFREQMAERASEEIPGSRPLGDKPRN